MQIYYSERNVIKRILIRLLASITPFFSVFDQHNGTMIRKLSKNRAFSGNNGTPFRLLMALDPSSHWSLRHIGAVGVVGYIDRHTKR